MLKNTSTKVEMLTSKKVEMLKNSSTNIKVGTLEWNDSTMSVHPIFFKSYEVKISQSLFSKLQSPCKLVRM